MTKTRSLRPPLTAPTAFGFSRITAAFAAAALAGCVGGVGVTPAGPTGGSTSSTGGTAVGGVGVGAAAGTGNGAGGKGGSTASSTGGNEPQLSNDPLIPARIRRLTNAEYDSSVQALLGTQQTFAQTAFPRDARQNNFTVNDAQRVDPVLAKQLSEAATSLAAEAKAAGKLAALAPCANATSGGEACGKTFIQTFGGKAYRRTLTSDEVTAFQGIYRVGAEGATYLDGIDAVVRAVLQSPGFLYITEIGDGTPAVAGAIKLTPSEVANTLAFLATSAPPDDALIAAGDALMNAEMREQQLRRLLETAAGKRTLVRIIREWLGVDRIDETAKDSTVYPAFAGLRNSMAAESVNFVDEVVNRSTGTLTELLGADWTVADGNLASFYGVTSAGTGKTSLASTGRRGILNQAAFLSVFAHASESAPVLRGVSAMKRVACLPVISPLVLNIMVTPPVPDPNKTTRERYAIHATDDKCAACHNSIDGFGFSFEAFDGMGAARPIVNGKPMDNNHPTDSSSTIPSGVDFAGKFTDSNALAMALSTSVDVRTCMARQLFRSFAARSDASVQGSEQDFVTKWKTMGVDKQNNFAETLVAYVKSPSFVQRRPQ